jgi:hypothetical protein
MKRIKVTGYVDPADLPEGWLDEAAASGLTEEAYDQAQGYLISGPLGMHDIDITAEQ